MTFALSFESILDDFELDLSRELLLAFGCGRSENEIEGFDFVCLKASLIFIDKGQLKVLSMLLT